jgi:KRAB domain-containing zinc finger protein
MFNCDVCDYSTPYKGDLKKHKMFEEDTRNYQCVECDKTFITNSDLRRHGKTHENAKKLICSFPNCGFATARKEHLLNHESTHTSIEARLNYPCCICTEYFSSRSVLNRHMKTCSKPKKSTEPKPDLDTKCETCEKVFSNIYKLRQHRKNHESVLEFVCGTCGKGFGTNESLIKHEALHLDKKFICDICEKPFGRADYLAKHKSTHFRVKSKEQLVCRGCNLTLPATGELQIHESRCQLVEKELIFIPNYSHEVVITQVEEAGEQEEEVEEQVYYLII